MQGFLLNAGRALANRITIIAYERLLAEKNLQMPHGTYIFASIGRALGSHNPPSPVRQWAMRLHHALVRNLGPARVLNDPSKSLWRFELLRQLHANGMNGFSVYRAGEQDSAMRFPVFLRSEHGAVWEAPPVARFMKRRRGASPGPT